MKLDESPGEAGDIAASIVLKIRSLFTIKSNLGSLRLIARLFPKGSHEGSHSGRW
jgi:hypothetical protein